jgi:hypothetical protein
MEAVSGLRAAALFPGDHAPFFAIGTRHIVIDHLDDTASPVIVMGS